MDNRLIVALDARDSSAAHDFIEAEPDRGRVLAMYHGAIRHLYWGAKDLPTLLDVARSAFVFGERCTSEAELGLVKGIAYDVGSFCWPGWDEPGIIVTPQALTAGAAAANLNLDLAKRLNRPDGPLAHAHWLVGAYHLASGDRSSASASFDRARALAAGDPVSEVLFAGYLALVRGERLDKDAILAVEEGAELLQQLETAARIFAL